MRLTMCLVVLMLTTGYAGYARVNFRKLTTFPVYINYPDSSQKACVLNVAGGVKPRQDAFYYWYGNNMIQSTQGGFSGRLLHGTYMAFHPNHNLKSQGCFDHGLKTGKWTTWYPSGRIHEIIYFSHGQAHGLGEVYDAEGNIVTRSYYRNGVRHGKTIYFIDGKPDSTVCYKRGVIVPMKECQDSTRRSSLIKRKKSDSLRDAPKSDSVKVKGKKEKRMKLDSARKNDEAKDTTKNRFRKLFHPGKKAD